MPSKHGIGIYDRDRTKILEQHPSPIRLHLGLVQLHIYATTTAPNLHTHSHTYDSRQRVLEHPAVSSSIYWPTAVGRLHLVQLINSEQLVKWNRHLEYYS